MNDIEGICELPRAGARSCACDPVLRAVAGYGELKRAAAMRLGIMQPYFFPYLGHFALIAAVDECPPISASNAVLLGPIDARREIHVRATPPNHRRDKGS